MSPGCLGSDAPRRDTADHQEAGGGGRTQRALPRESCQLLPPFRPQTTSLTCSSPSLPAKASFPKPLPPLPAHSGDWGLKATSCPYPLPIAEVVDLGSQTQIPAFPVFSPPVHLQILTEAYYVPSTLLLIQL